MGFRGCSRPRWGAEVTSRRLASRFPAEHTRAGRVLRLLVGLVAFALLLTACAPLDVEDGGGDPHTIVIDEDGPAPEDPDPEDDGAQPRPEQAEQREQSETPTSDEPAPTPQPSEPEPAEPAEPRQQPTEPAPAVIRDDRGPLGSACRPYLRGDVPALTIEVLHHRAARPSSAALDHLVSSLRPVLDKPGGIDVAGPREIPGDARTWRLDDLQELAERHRQVTSSESRASMLVLSVAGEYEDPGVLGLAMSATEIVIFPQQIGDLATSLLGGSSRIERSVLLHEAGHLLCLVNIGYTSELDHEDPDHPHHSRHRDSVMFWAVPNDAVTQVFTGPPPDSFHEDDLADLRGLREGRY
jgi:hypothetical protein